MSKGTKGQKGQMRQLKPGQVVPEGWLWRDFFDHDYLSAWDVDEEDLVVIIKEVRWEEVTGTKGLKELKLVCYFHDMEKGMILNNENNKRLSRLFKTKEVAKWYQKKIQLYAEETTYKGEQTYGLRVREFLPKDKPTTPLDRKTNSFRSAITVYKGPGQKEIRTFMLKMHKSRKLTEELLDAALSHLELLDKKNKAGEVSDKLLESIMADLEDYEK